MKTICITGLDGCGKTTQAKLLAEKLPDSRIVSVWDLIKRPEFQSWTIYKNPPDVEQYVANLHPVSRSLFIFHAFDAAYRSALKSGADYIIFDGYWYKYWAVEQAMGAPPELGHFFSSQYLEPDYIFYLMLPLEELLKRKKQISVYEAANQTDRIKAFLDIQNRAGEILQNLLPEHTIHLNASENIENLHQKILKNLNF